MTEDKLCSRCKGNGFIDCPICKGKDCPNCENGFIDCPENNCYCGYVYSLNDIITEEEINVLIDLISNLNIAQKHILK